MLRQCTRTLSRPGQAPLPLQILQGNSFPMGASLGVATIFGLIIVVSTDLGGESQLLRHTPGSDIAEKRGPDE